jgi:hypothetical protein
MAPAVTTPGEYSPDVSVKNAWMVKFENIQAAVDKPKTSVHSEGYVVARNTAMITYAMNMTFPRMNCPNVLGAEKYRIAQGTNRGLSSIIWME